MQRPGFLTSVLFAATIFLLVGCDRGQPPASDAQQPPPYRAPASRVPLESARRTAITQAVERVAPAVVTVQTESVERVEPDPFAFFFGGNGAARERTSAGIGSGFIVRPDGQIITNAHVVAGATRVFVAMRDGTTYPAKVVGIDELNDVAVVDIEANNLPVAPLGSSSDLLVGEWAIAIGNPYGFLLGNSEPSVSAGVISAVGRNLLGRAEGGGAYLDMIQTDAAINPGNSGGPLVNLRGELVGINTAVPGPTGQGVQPSGIGFAISINEAKPIVQQLLTSGRVTRPYLGVAPVTITPAIRAQLGLSVDKGVILDTVATNSPAARAGLRQGDVIVAADGKPVADESALRQAIASHRIGDTMRLTVLRDGREMDVQVQLAQAPAP